jgi:exonuclease III
VPEGGAGQVEADRDVIRLQVGKAPQDDAAEAEDAVHQLTLRRREGWQGVVAAVHEPEAVEQHQAFHGRLVDWIGRRSRDATIEKNVRVECTEAAGSLRLPAPSAGDP